MFSDLSKLEDRLFENGFWPTLAASVVIALLAYVLIKLVNKAIERLSARGRFNAASLTYTRRIIAVVIGLLAVLGIFMQVKPLQSVARSLLASSGVLAVILGFAAQQAMANVVGGLFISVFKPFSIDDRVRLPEKDISGFVEDISLRHTVIRTFENNRVIVPNSLMNSAVIENFHYQDGKVCRFLDLNLSLSADIEKAMAIITEEVLAHKSFYDNRTEEERTAGLPAVAVQLVSLADSCARLRTAVWAQDAGTGYEMVCSLLLRIKKRFDTEGIELYNQTKQILVSGQQ